MSEKAASFVRNWVSDNVHNNPLVDGDGFDRHIANLRTDLVVAASEAGIALPEIEETVGDLEDHLRHEFEVVFDPSVGGVKD